MMQTIKMIHPDPQDWEKLEKVAEIDRQAFAEDGISVFNLSQFARSGAVFCLLNDETVVAEAVILRNIHDYGAIVFGFAVEQNFQNKGYGYILMQQILREVTAAGITYLELTMNPEKLSAKKFYMEKTGFYKKAELAVHPHKREPRWLMRLDLP